MPYFTPTDIPYAASARSDLLDTNFTAIRSGFNLLPVDTDLKRGTVNYAADTGAANAYLVSLPNAPASYTDGLLVSMKTSNANTGASTINVNGLGVKNIKTAAGSDPVANDILGFVDLRYDAPNNHFKIALSASAISSASAAAASAASASGSAGAASSSASAAAISAASINLPSITGNALKFLRAKSDETGLEYIAVTQNWVAKTTTYQAVSGDRIAADTSGGAFTVTLPATPTTGHYVEFCDGGSSWATYSLTIARNGSTIMGLSEDMTASTNNDSFGLVYNGSTWRFF